MHMYNSSRESRQVKACTKMASTKHFFCKIGAFLLITLLVVILLSAVLAQETTAAPMVTDGFEVTAERVGDGTCQCSVKSPIVVICTDFQTQDNLVKLRDIQEQVANLTLDVTKLYHITNWHSGLITSFETNLADVTATFNRIEGGQLLVTRGEIEGIRRVVRNMASAVYTLREWYGVESDEAQVGKIQVIMNDITNVSEAVDALIAHDTSEDLAAMQLQITELSSQLSACNQPSVGHTQSTPAQTVNQPSPSVGTATVAPDASEPAGQGRVEQTEPERWPKKAKQNSCGRLVSISEPYTLRGNLQSSGAWMRDPVVRPEFVYYHNFLSAASQTKLFEGSASLMSFQRDQTHRITGDKLHHIIEAITYNGSLFAYSVETIETRERRRHYSYQTVYTKIQNISKIEWSTHSASFPTFVPGNLVTREISSDAPLDRFAYSAPSVVPKMDFMVDESGLWLLYSDAQEMIVVSKVDQETLEFERTLEGSYPKNRVGNCFIICRRVYCLSSSEKFDARVAYYMDTDTGFEGFVNIPFIIKYGSLSSIEYNPYDQTLYGWDNGHAVMYSLTFE